MSQRLTPRCDFCDIEMIDGQCPECFSILLTELWRRQDMAEMLTRSVERDLRFTIELQRKARAA